MANSTCNSSIGPVLHLVDSFQIGGTESQAVRLIQELRGKGHRVDVSCLNREGPLLKLLPGQDIREYRLKKFFHAGTLLKLAALRNELRVKKIEILHCHDFYTNVFGVLAGRFAGTPLIIASRRDMGDLIRPSQQTLQRIVLRLSHHVVANAHAVQQHVIEKENILPEKTSVIYNGIDLPRPFVPREMREPGQPFRVAMVANFNHAWKGHSYLIKAARVVLESDCGTEFVLAGEGPLREGMQRLSRELGIRDKIRFPGVVSSSQICHHSDVLISSSLSEGLSNAVIEAMAYGIPVVGTRVGGNIELIERGKGGLLVEPGNPPLLAEAIIWMLKHPAEAYEMGLSGRRFVEERFSWETTRKAYESLYRSLSTKGHDREVSKVFGERPLHGKKDFNNVSRGDKKSRSLTSWTACRRGTES